MIGVIVQINGEGRVDCFPGLVIQDGQFGLGHGVQQTTGVGRGDNFLNFGVGDVHEEAIVVGAVFAGKRTGDQSLVLGGTVEVVIGADGEGLTTEVEVSVAGLYCLAVDLRCGLVPGIGKVSLCGRSSGGSGQCGEKGRSEHLVQ